MIKNEKGLTLVEVLGALILTGVVLTLFFSLMSYTSTGVKRIMSKEEAMQEAQTIIQHITEAARREDCYKVAKPEANEPHLKLEGPRNQLVEYTFEKGTLTATSLLENHPDTLGPEQTFTFNKGIEDIRFVASPGSDRIELTIVMRVGNSLKSNKTIIHLLNDKNRACPY